MSRPFYDIENTYVECDVYRELLSGEVVNETLPVPKQLAQVGAALSIRVRGRWEGSWIVRAIVGDPIAIPVMRRAACTIRRRPKKESLMTPN
jgi:hypothetical protein